MNKQAIVAEFDKEQKTKYNRPMQPYHRHLVGDFFDFLAKVKVEVPDSEIMEAIEADSMPRVQKAISHTLSQDGKLNIALITEDVGHLTGGRYYVWFIVMALVELGHSVTVYTNQEPVFHEDFKLYKQPEVKVIAKRAVDLQNIDVQADIYIGSPTSGNVAAMKLGSKYGKPSFAIVFDPFPMMETFIGKRNYSGWENFMANIGTSQTKIISLCQSTSDYIYTWLNRRHDQVVPIYPCINSREKALADQDKTERGDYILFISRLVKHKKFEDVLQVAKENNVKVVVVSSIDGMAARRLVHTMGMEKQVKFIFKANDKEKFKLIRGARAMINGAIFEGFGMWAAEALACGVPLVCYDYPTFREIKHLSGANNFYFAEWNNPKDLSRKLATALAEAKYTEDNDTFSFDNMVGHLKNIFDFEPRIGVVTIALNEEKFIGASLRSVIRHPNVKRVAVVEGAVNLFAHAANNKGLSVDDTRSEIAKVFAMEHGEKIIYDRYGWASDKSELRNRALKLLGDDVDYVLVVDGDEVWKQEDLDELVKMFKEYPRSSVVKFSFYHFWKNKKQITKGSQWDSFMFRCFKFEDKTLHWGQHNMPVVNSQGKSVDNMGDIGIHHDIHVYHYGAMKEEKRIVEKLKYYAARDKQLKVKNTWSDWKEGQETQWTHGGGYVVKFNGTHPDEVKGIT